MNKTPAVLYVERGSTIQHAGREYAVVRLLDLGVVLAKEMGSSEKVILKLGDLNVAKPAPTTAEPVTTSQPTERDLLDVSDEDWEVAEYRLQIIQPFLSDEPKARAHYKELAEKADVSTATLYRWVAAYKNSRLLSSLLPRRRNGGAGKSRLAEDVELVIKDRIDNFYLSSGNLTRTQYECVLLKCQGCSVSGSRNVPSSKLDPAFTIVVVSRSTTRSGNIACS